MSLTSNTTFSVKRLVARCARCLQTSYTCFCKGPIATVLSPAFRAKERRRHEAISQRPGPSGPALCAPTSLASRARTQVTHPSTSNRRFVEALQEARGSSTKSAVLPAVEGRGEMRFPRMYLCL